MNTPYYWPMMTLVLWTMCIGLLAAYRRVHEARSRKIPLRLMARARDVACAFDDTTTVDNFNNLLQVPLLFYVWCLTVITLHITDSLLLALAWVYVASRVWHTYIQITHNKVLQRFRMWLLSNIVLIALWIGSLVHLI